MSKQRVVIDRFDGRDTAYISVERRSLLSRARPVLHWLAMGAAEPFDVWLTVDLTWDESDAFIASPPARFDRFVSSLVGRPFRLSLSIGSVRVVRIESEVAVGGNAVKHGMDELRRRLQSLADSHRPHSEQAREVAPKLIVAGFAA